MIKKTVQYENFDGDQATATLYFNITKTEVVDNLHLIDRFQELAHLFDGERRTLNNPEVGKLLALVKEIVRISYGIKSPDGERFEKSEAIWEAFTQTAVYDTFLFSLFQNEGAADEFLSSVFPKDFVQIAEEARNGQNVPVEDAQVNFKEVDRVKSPVEMSREELIEAMRLKNQQ